MKSIKVPSFVIVITLLTSTIATVLGVWAALFTETHPQYLEGAYKLVLSWSGRELGQGLSGLFAVFVLRDARAIAIVLLSAWVREVIDFIDFFRIAGTPLRLYFVVGTSVILHSTALYFTWDAIRKHKQDHQSLEAGVVPNSG